MSGTKEHRKVRAAKLLEPESIQDYMWPPNGGQEAGAAEVLPHSRGAVGFLGETEVMEELQCLKLEK